MINLIRGNDPSPVICLKCSVAKESFERSSKLTSATETSLNVCVCVLYVIPLKAYSGTLMKTVARDAEHVYNLINGLETESTAVVKYSFPSLFVYADPASVLASGPR